MDFDQRVHKMSETSDWIYTQKLLVKPYLGRDSWGEEEAYGPEYEIRGTWTAEAEQQRDQTGAEFVSRHTVFTPDPRPKRLDLIKPVGSPTWTQWEEIRNQLEWDMSFFGETPDFKVVT